MSPQNIRLPNGTTVEMAILSTDIQGSSTLSEEIRADLNRTLLSFAEHHLTEIASKVVAKVDGDGLLVITGDAVDIPRIASRLLGIFQAETYRLQKSDLKLRMGASFGRVTLVRGLNDLTDANGDPIIRAVRIQAANAEAKEMWCDESVIQALIRSGAKAQISVVGKKDVRDFGKLAMLNCV